MDNRPPKHLRTLKRGDVREDGMVFHSYQPHIPSGEWWVTPEHLDRYRKSNNDLQRKRHKENPEIRRDLEAKWYQQPTYRLIRIQRARIRDALKGKAKSKNTIGLLGCTSEEFKAHLEAQFQEGMSWDNYGEWHVDHIKPCSKYDLTLDKEQEDCFNYRNTQPLWASDNLSKGSKYNNNNNHN